MALFMVKWKDSNLTPVFKSGQKDVQLPSYPFYPKYLRDVFTLEF